MSKKKYILEQVSENDIVKKELTDSMPTVVKVLDSLVFGKTNINYSIKLREMKYGHPRKRNDNSSPFKKKNEWRDDSFYLEVDLDVEVDRLNRSLPVFDQTYEDFMFSMEDRIPAALEYVGLKSLYRESMLSYIDDSETERQMDKLNDSLYDELQKEYPDVPLDLIKKSDLYYYLYKQEDSSPYIRVEVGGEAVVLDATESHTKGEVSIATSETVITCDELWEIMKRVYENNAIGNAFDLENFLCH